MNSHQSLAEALEMCKYTENFTSHGARSCSHGNPPPKKTPPDSNERPSSTYSSISGYVLFWNTDPPEPRIKEHNTATSEVTYSCVYQQFTTCNTDTEAPRFTSHVVAFGPRERSRTPEELCNNRWEKKKPKRSREETSARLTHTNDRFTLYGLSRNPAERGS